MPFYLLIAVLPAIATAASGSVAVYAWKRREVNGARAFALCAFSIFVWCFFSFLEHLSFDSATRILFGWAQYIGIAPFAALWLVFTLRYAQADGWLGKRAIATLAFTPVTTWIFAFASAFNLFPQPWAQGWIWRDVSVQMRPFPQLVIEHGWWFNYVMVPQCYLLLIAGFGVLLSACFTGSQLYRTQTLVLLIGALVPFICNVLYVVSGITFYGLDMTPVGFAFGGVLIQLGLFRTRFLDIAPVSYRTVFLNSADAIVLLDVRYRIVDLNPAALTEGRIPFALETVIGQPFEQVFPDYEGLLRNLSKAAELGISTELTQTIRLPKLFDRRQSEHLTEVFREVKVRSLTSPGGKCVGWAIMIHDVTLENQQREQLEQFAYVDSLTGLFNRRQLQIKAEELFGEPEESTLTEPQASPQRSEGMASRVSSIKRQTRPPLALLYIDLNRFKPINDKYGHDVGDLVLQHFAQCLSRSVRKGDMVARLGGDEFAALLHNADSRVAYEVRSRLSHMLSQTTVIAGRRFTLSASIGVAYYPLDGRSLADLLRQADMNMYQEKQQMNR